MIAYGFSQLEYVPKGDALESLSAAALARLPEFRSQATSNLLYALARLEHYPPALCAAAEEHAVACIVSYRPQVQPRCLLLDARIACLNECCLNLL